MSEHSFSTLTQQRIEEIIDGGNPIEIALLKTEIEHSIDKAHNELAHYEFYLVQSAHLKNCTLCKPDQDGGNKND